MADSVSLQTSKWIPSGRLRNWLLGAFLAVVTFLAYTPALNGKFVWDDGSWTTDIPGLLQDFQGLCLMWAEPTALQQYYPLAGTTFWIDYQLWKFWTLPYHVENILLHIAAVLLFWKLLQRLYLPGAWLAAAIFALHPVMVESVAWITERKNVLSLVFFLGALLAYARFCGYWVADAQANVVEPIKKHWGAYLGAMVLFLGALLAKSTAFSLPAVILVIGWWKRGRLRWRADILPLLPMFALAIGMSVLVAWLETNHVGAQGEEWNLSFAQRCLIAGHAVWFYLGNLLWPANLCFIYPRWDPVSNEWGQWLFPLGAVGLLALLWFARGRVGRGGIATALLFVGTLFPVLGFMNAYGMRYSFVWDHWVYLSSLPVIALVAALIAQLARCFQLPLLSCAIALLLLPTLWGLTWNQAKMYKDIETLWHVTIDRNPKAFIAYNNLGYILLEDDKAMESIPYFEKSLDLAPNYFEARNNLGDACMRLGHLDEAIGWFKETIRLAPTYAEAHYNLGNALLKVGRNREAIAEFFEAIKLNPGFAKADNNLGVALMRTGRGQQAMLFFQRAMAIDPDYTDANNNLANLLAVQGRRDEAMDQYRAVIQMDPNYAEAYCELANLLTAATNTDEAVQLYQTAVQINPNYIEAHYNLAVLLAARGQLDDASVHFRAAIQLKSDYANAHGNLANVLAAQGKLDEAVREYQTTLRLAPDSAQAHFRLGEVLQKQNQKEAAINEYRQVLKLDPKHTGAQQKLRELGAP